MCRNIKAIIVFLFLFTLSFSQTIKGTIKDKDGKFIELSYIEFKDANESGIAKEFSLIENGKFEYNLTKSYGKLLIKITSNGYLSKIISIDDVSILSKSFDITLIEDKERIIKEIIIVSDNKPVTVKEDTISYNVSKFRDGTERKIEDVIKKLPGISVNEKTGEIKYKGKSIETVTLDGDNMFGDNYTMGTKNISVDLIDQVQAIDNFSDNKLLKDIENGDKVSLNLKLKKGVVDYSGDIEQGLGINENVKLLNKSDVNILQISKNYKAILLGNYNNIGENNSSYDFLSGSISRQEIKNKSFESIPTITDVLYNNFVDVERINNNNLLYATYNNLFKVSNRLNIKSNVLFLNDKMNFSQLDKTENLVNNSTFETSDFSSITKKPSVFNAGFDAVYNLSSKSLLEYKFSYLWNKTKSFSEILQNNSFNIKSELESTRILLHQNLIYTSRLNQNQVFQADIVYAISKTPQEYNLTSQNNVIFQKIALGKNIFDGTLKLLGKTQSLKYAIHLKTNLESFNFQSDNLNLFVPNNDQYSKKTFSQLNSLSYSKNKWLISSSVGFKLISQSLTNNKLTAKDLFVEPSIFLKYKINEISFISSSYSLSRSTIFETHNFQNPVIISNRITTENVLDLSLQKTSSFNLMYTNNNVYRKFLFEVNYDFQDNKGNFYPKIEVNPNAINIKNIFLNLANQSHNFRVNTVKYVSSISSSLKYKADLSYANYFNFLNSEILRKNYVTSLSNDFSINTSFRSKINFDNNLNFTQIINESNNLELTNKSIINTFKLRYKLTKTQILSFKLDYYLPNISDKNNQFVLFDIDFSSIPKGKNYEIYFTLRNLFNQNSINQIQNNDYSNSLRQNYVLPRFFLLSFVYNL